MADGVTVDLAALSTFAQNVGKIFHEKMPDVSAIGQEMMRACAGMMSSAPIAELSSFSMYHMQMVGAASTFMATAVSGTESLANGAMTCAVRYASADQFTMEKLKQMVAEYNKTGDPSVFDFTLKGSGNVSSTDVTTAFAPPPPSTGSGTKPPANLTLKDPQSASPAAAPKPGDFQTEVNKYRDNIDEGKVSQPSLPDSLGDGSTPPGDQVTVPADKTTVPTLGTGK